MENEKCINILCRRDVQTEFEGKYLYKCVYVCVFMKTNFRLTIQSIHRLSYKIINKIMLKLIKMQIKFFYSNIDSRISYSEKRKENQITRNPQFSSFLEIYSILYTTRT